MVLSPNDVPDGTGDIWLTNLACVGSEANLLACPGTTLNSVDSCVHNEDVGVRCVSSSSKTVESDC